MGLSPETRFGFRHSLWLRGCDLASRVFVESIVNAGMRDSSGIRYLSGKRGGKWGHCKVSWKRPKAQRWECVCFLA